MVLFIIVVLIARERRKIKIKILITEYIYFVCIVFPDSDLCVNFDSIVTMDLNFLSFQLKWEEDLFSLYLTDFLRLFSLSLLMFWWVELLLLLFSR